MSNAEHYGLLLLLACSAGAWMVVLTGGRWRSWLAMPDRMAAWPIQFSEFLGFAALVLASVVLGSLVAVSIFGAPPENPPTPRAILIHGYAMNLSALLACGAFQLLPIAREPPTRAPVLAALRAGVVAFLLIIPILSALGLGWQALLKLLKLPADPQPIVEYVRAAAATPQFGYWVVLAGVLAPLTEELVFRAAIFRFLSTRISPGLAAVFVSVLFALLHQNLFSFAPLFVLSLVLCLIYRKTGSVAAPFMLHAVFNLNTLLFTALTPPE